MSRFFIDKSALSYRIRARAEDRNWRGPFAEVAELVDALGSGPSGGNTVGVRVPSSVPSPTTPDSILSVRGIESLRENFASSFGRRERCMLLLCLAAGAACAEPLPLWEAGAGVGATRLAHYPGAHQYRNLVLPLPHLVYPGDMFK